MAKKYRPYELEQDFLMPISLQDWLPDDHLVYFLSDVVDELDLSAIMSRYEAEERGYPPYHPKMMVKVLIYAYCIGVPSSRKIAQRLEEDIAFRVLAANNTPDFRTISDFRKDHVQALAMLFVHVLRLCQKAGLVKLGHVSIDGSKMKANASKHKAMSYGRMKQEEARLEAEVMRIFEEADRIDGEEDRRYGRNKKGGELPQELARRENRLKKIREAMAALEMESEGGKPSDKAQRNFTDPDSRIMPVPGGKDFVQAYNAQAVVDSGHQIIVAAELTNKPTDKGQAVPLVEATRDNTGQLPSEVSADAGYFSSKAVEALSALGIEPLIPPDKTRHSISPPPAPRGRIPKNLSPADRMRRKLHTKKGRASYALRKQVVEPVFGQIKHARGFRQFMLRGLEKVRAEWLLICLTHNLLKLFGATKAPRRLLMKEVIVTV